MWPAVLAWQDISEGEERQTIERRGVFLKELAWLELMSPLLLPVDLQRFCSIWERRTACHKVETFFYVWQSSASALSTDGLIVRCDNQVPFV